MIEGTAPKRKPNLKRRRHQLPYMQGGYSDPPMEGEDGRMHSGGGNQGRGRGKYNNTTHNQQCQNPNQDSAPDSEGAAR